MKKLLLLILIYSSLYINAQLNDSILEIKYSDYYNKIKNNIAVISIINEGYIEVSSEYFYKFITLTDDYIDSIKINSFFIDSASNDTFFISYTLKEKNMFLSIESDFVNPLKNIIKMEAFSVYNGHNFIALLGDKCNIVKKGNNYFIYNLGNNVLIDSIIINKTQYLPYSIFMKSAYGKINININNYKKFYGYLFIPDTIVITNDNKTFNYKSYITKLEIKKK